uniref:Thiamin pyrophosphokinase thiamin-binding domain-containing protein n=1 Tax=Timema genevievae TaxID=629358 RepID=A0A7R9JT81_TIMGE|nr:unnamed protein product [Timema genevievae]
MTGRLGFESCLGVLTVVSPLHANEDGQSMEFGKLLSTSNTYSDKPVVTVQTDTALTWSMGLGTVDD